MHPARLNQTGCPVWKVLRPCDQWRNGPVGVTVGVMVRSELPLVCNDSFCKLFPTPSSACLTVSPSLNSNMIGQTVPFSARRNLSRCLSPTKSASCFANTTAKFKCHNHSAALFWDHGPTGNKQTNFTPKKLILLCSIVAGVATRCSAKTK